MTLLRGALGLDPHGFRVEDGLVELTFGRWEGMTWREVRAAAPALAAERERDKWGYAPPDGESYAALAERLRPAVAALARPAVIVSHGGVARALLHLLAGVPAAAAPRVDIHQGRVLVVDGSRYWWA